MRSLSWLLLLGGCLAAQTVKDDQHPLRAGCAESDPTLARLKKGDPVKIRFVLAGSNRPCYSVTAEADGKTVQGYLGADALEGLEKFDEARRRASSAVLPAVSRAITSRPVEEVRQSAGKPNYALAAEVFRAAAALEAGRPAEVEPILAKAGAPAGHRDVAMLRGSALIELNQPDRALDLLQPALKEHKKDPQLLALAGLASYRLDKPRDAMAYWKESLETRPDPNVTQMLAKVEREMGADKSTQTTYGTRFLLRYDGAVADPETARSMVAVLDQEFARVAFQLGCRAEERIITIVQSRTDYRKTTGSPEWNGGQFDGKIRIPVEAAKRIDPETRQTMTHELVHACISNLGPWPTWVHEGFAQKLSGEVVGTAQRQKLKELAKAGKLPKLTELGEGWSRFSVEGVALRYAVALAAVDMLFQKQGAVAGRNLMNNPEGLPRVTAELDRAMREVLSQ